jgi:hypothetical protein
MQGMPSDSSNYFDTAFPETQLDVNSFEESKRLLRQPHNPHMYEKPQKHVEPKIQYKEKIYNNQYNSYLPHKPSLDNIVGEMNTYKTKVNKTYDFNSDSQFFTPQFNKNNCRKEELDYMYKNVGEMTGGDLRNIDIETYIKFGSPTSKARSLGFENPVEHFFSYIDDSIQDPDHVCFDRPQLTRNMNRKSFRSGSDY